MTPKKRMLKSTVGLAKALKPTGRLNVDDMKRASDARKKMSLSQIKGTKKLGKATKSINDIFNKMKQEPGMVGMPKSPEGLKAAMKTAGTMGLAGDMKGIKELMKKVSDAKKRSRLIKAPARRAKPASVISRRRARVKR